MGSQQPFKINTFCTFGNHFHQELLYQWFLLATGARNFSHWFTFISTPNFRDLTLRITCMFMVHVMFWTQTDQMRSRRFVNGTSDAVVMARSIWTVMLVSVNKAMFHQSSCTISSTYALIKKHRVLFQWSMVFFARVLPVRLLRQGQTSAVIAMGETSK